MSNRWNYKVVEVKPHWMGVKPKQIEETLAPLGALGWELVGVSHLGLSAFLYLKKAA